MAAARRAHRSAGMALLLVLWCTAALAVLVTGMVGAQRSELRLASAARGQVQATALGVAAIQRVVQQIAGTATPVARLQRRPLEFDGQPVTVEILPVSGLIDLGNAPVSLLSDLFAQAGGLPEPAAMLMAEAVETRRKQPGAPGLPRSLEAPEDLLTVPGFDVDLLGRIAGLVIIGGPGSGKINPLCAPDGVLLVLARGNAAVAARIAAARDTGEVAVDTTMLPAQHVDSAVGTRFRLTARVPRPDGGAMLVVRDIDIRAPETGGPPWRTLRASIRTEEPRVRQSMRGEGA